MLPFVSNVAKMRLQREQSAREEFERNNDALEERRARVAGRRSPQRRAAAIATDLRRGRVVSIEFVLAAVIVGIFIGGFLIGTTRGTLSLQCGVETSWSVHRTSPAP